MRWPSISELHRRLPLAAEWVADAAFNRVAAAWLPVPPEGAGPSRGIVSAGFCTRKLADVIGAGGAAEAGLGLLELGGIFPLPAAPVRDFLAAHDEVLILEENEPYLERHIAALAHASRLSARVRRQADRGGAALRRAVPLADRGGGGGLRPGVAGERPLHGRRGAGGAPAAEETTAPAAPSIGS